MFFDTETDGLGNNRRLVQLAAIVTEEDGTLRNSCNFIIKPEGYEIPKESSNIHGITTETALKYGMPLSVVVSTFNNFLMMCEGGTLIAHNIQFDVKVIENCYKVGNWPNRLGSLKRYCTMESTRNLVRMPPTPGMLRAGIRQFKSPKLSEAFQFAFEKPLENAHDALYDVNACKDIYFWIKGPKDIIDVKGLEGPDLLDNTAASSQ